MFCDECNNVISFFHNRIMSCCAEYIGLVYYENYNGKSKIDWSRFLEKKNEFFSILDSEQIKNINCSKCFFIREKTSSDIVSLQFKEINISHWANCNCNCIYCLREQEDKTKKQQYKMLPIVKELYKNNLLDKENLIVRFQGGDISVLKEFPALVKEFDKNGVKEFHFLSNNIIYQPIIRDMFNKNKAVLVTSLDAGCKETFKRIKQVDKFDICIKNLKKYKKDCRDKANLNVKYIIIPEYNDNIQEAIKFLNIMKELDIKLISYDIDYRKIMIDSDIEFIIPKEYYKIYELFQNYCNENGAFLDVCSHTKSVLNNGFYKCHKTINQSF